MMALCLATMSPVAVHGQTTPKAEMGAMAEHDHAPAATSTSLTLTVDGKRPGPKDMGTVMKTVQQRIAANGLRADGKVVSELVKAELAK